MKLVERIKKKLGIKEKIQCSCGNIITVDLFDNDKKAHKIGQVRKNTGELMTIYCNGREIFV